ncbi:hypothetical protein ASPWEDRAFT_29799 [Aspergillus wentii DTO 134E9]|uniref:FAD-binding PCMH-type domain-containing protein n=1 Tax=Aspergillus wentii DTO 134E9 TaxID=1073089 RepID=A0A1L9RCK6_ASPWE|nr:uncharacterized protein ASPWEDRAFT_29799 [Aspergillus wentii DTO 134E9]OJJ32641.1 hypothetical protein ASPWEDRAFT_29799 [Aspergillus wentii DTO 134E9]
MSFVRLALVASIFSSWVTLGLASDTTNPCDELSNSLPGKVVLPGNPQYQSDVSSYFFLNQRIDPFCIVVPTSAEDVSLSVKILTKHPSTPFAIRGGGHSPNRGASNAENGVTIDFQSMKEVANYGPITSVGPGAAWSDVYSVLDPKGLTVVGGRVAGVGVGGLTTGGGISAFSPELGFACDNVANMQVVLANGEIVNANATSNADLFIALKGGQNNFGIVTRFDLKTHQRDEYWGGSINYPQEAEAAQLAAFTEFKDPANFDQYAEIEQSFLYIGQEKAFYSSNNMYYTKPVVNATGLKYFTDVQPQVSSTMRIANTSSFAEELASVQPQNQFHSAEWATTTFAISPTILGKVHGLWNASAVELTPVTNLTSVLTFQSVPAPQPSSPNSLGIDPKSSPEKNLVLALVNQYWSLESDSDKANGVTEELMSNIDDLLRQEGLYVDYKYLNYAGPFQDPLGSYGDESLERMKKVSTKYDPTGVFQKQVKGGFKLFK